MWWAKDDKGYTCDIRCAKVFTNAEREEYISKGGTKVFHQKEVIDRLVQHHIDVQDVRKKDQRKHPWTIEKWRPDLMRMEEWPMDRSCDD